ncbi:MAG: aldo/keto reductase [Prevotella sp.]|nr:aldo/keto reductase [Prevotella sp.]
MAKKKGKIDLGRRDFLRRLGVGAGSAVAVMALEPFDALANPLGRKKGINAGNDDPVRMTYRVQHGTGEQISLLGFGMMRLPNDQEQVNQMVDYAIEHGVNYFDTAPMYMGGRSEVLTGNALSRHPREKYHIATKMSNQSPSAWDFDKAKEMYETSFQRLKVDYIDYYLLHSIGGGGVDNLESRFIKNGLLDFLLAERKAGRIKHLGFSYHGDVSAFDWLLDHQDDYHWDFVQIQMNFLDWRHASIRGGRRHDADAEYLYDKCEKTGVQCVVMEPLRGGALSKVDSDVISELNALRPDDSPARWAFRWVGSHPNILTTLSGMNRMDHLEENVATFSPLDPCTQAEYALMATIADKVAGVPTIPCTTCEYCMPCPFGVNIPGNFAYYNDAVNKKIIPLPDSSSPDFATRKKQFVEGYHKALPDNSTWANMCQDCEACLSKCPQQIRIPNQLGRIEETLRG